MRILFIAHTGDYIGQTTLSGTDAMAVPSGWIPLPYEYAPQHLRDAADADQGDHAD